MAVLRLILTERQRERDTRTHIYASILGRIDTRTLGILSLIRLHSAAGRVVKHGIKGYADP